VPLGQAAQFPTINGVIPNKTALLRFVKNLQKQGILCYPSGSIIGLTC